jgi:hypothetical protein
MQIYFLMRQVVSNSANLLYIKLNKLQNKSTAPVSNKTIANVFKRRFIYSPEFDLRQAFYKSGIQIPCRTFPW